MKRGCKNIDLRNPEVLVPWVRDCVMRRRGRRDYRKLLVEHGMKLSDYKKAIANNDKEAFAKPIHRIAEDVAWHIARREIETGHLAPIVIVEKVDRTTGKVREIGRESAMQQIYDYVAVGAAQEIWDRRLVLQQASSIRNRGQVYGMKMIRSWIEADNRAMRWAKKHNRRYYSRCRYYVKLDVKKCYPNSRMNIFMELFERDCANEDLIWLWRTLLTTHLVNGYAGFIIGAPPSQWACQYMMSFIYRFAMSHRFGRKQDRSVSHMLIFLDDMLLMSSSRKALRKAVEDVIQYAKEKLGYTIKPNWNIRKLDETPIDMMGFVVYRNGKVAIRDYDFIRARRLALRCERNHGMSLRQAKRFSSYGGNFKYTDCRRAKEKYRIPQVKKLAGRIIGNHQRRANQNGNSHGILIPT